MSQCGVYQILCAGNGRVYVGSSRNIKRRWSEHKRELLCERHHNQPLQNCFKKYGIDSIHLSVLEITSMDQRLEREQFWMNKLSKTGRRLLNAATKADRPPSFSEWSFDAQESHRVRAREMARLVHKDPEIVLRRNQRLAELNKNPKFQQARAIRCSDQLKRLHKDPIFRAKNAAAAAISGSMNMNRLHADPEFRRRHLARLEIINTDAESRERCVKATQQANSKRCRVTWVDGRVSEFPSAKAASLATDVKQGTITFRCRERARPADGSQWEFV